MTITKLEEPGRFFREVPSFRRVSIVIRSGLVAFQNLFDRLFPCFHVVLVVASVDFHRR